MQGVLLHASPPIKHEPQTNYQGFEVTKYQPPWKMFSDFAMQNDTDDCSQTPGFQHLVNQVRNYSSFTQLEDLLIIPSFFSTASRLRFT